MKGFQPNITSLGFTRPAKRPVTVLSEIERHVVLNGRKSIVYALLSFETEISTARGIQISA